MRRRWLNYLLWVSLLMTGCTQSDSDGSSPGVSITPTPSAQPGSTTPTAGASLTTSPSPTPPPRMVPPAGMGDQRPSSAMFRFDAWDELMSASGPTQFVVNGRGDRLTFGFPLDPDAEHPSGPSCSVPWQQAWQWRAADGRQARWVSAAVFYIVPMLKGFLLVGACHARGLNNADMAWHYVDATGDRKQVSWDSEQVLPDTALSIVGCPLPRSLEFRRCAFDEEQLALAPADGLDLTYDIVAITRAGRIWAQTGVDYAAVWSDDGGTTWVSHRPRVGPDPTFRAGGHTAWFNDVAVSRRVELSVDDGETWDILRLPFAPATDAAVTARGSVLVFTRDGSTLMRRAPGPATNFEPTTYNGPAGGLTVLGPTLTITGTMDKSTWVSHDDGRTWKRLP